MDDKTTNKLRIIATIIIAALLVIMCISIYYNYKDSNTETTTETSNVKKFKKEYEKLNDSEGYISISVPTDFDVTYKSDEEILDIINNGSGIIYFGNSMDSKCRSIIETLIDAIKDSNITDFYYVDTTSIMPKFSTSLDTLEKTDDGTTSYYKILELLDDYLDEYVITDGDNQYDTGEKRLDIPVVVVVKNGTIDSCYTGSNLTLDDNNELSDEDKDNLYTTYTDMFKEYNKSTCEKDKGC